MKKMQKGFTLVEIMIVVAIIGLLAAIAIPSFMKSRLASRTSTCINNLRQLDGAKEQCAMSFRPRLMGSSKADARTLSARLIPAKPLIPPTRLR
jgi:prepilin-type N-terminal cleavage/methylation domain-containing protein